MALEPAFGWAPPSIGNSLVSGLSAAVVTAVLAQEANDPWRLPIGDV